MSAAVVWVPPSVTAWSDMPDEMSLLVSPSASAAEGCHDAQPGLVAVTIVGPTFFMAAPARIRNATLPASAPPLPACMYARATIDRTFDPAGMKCGPLASPKEQRTVLEFAVAEMPVAVDGV